MNDTATILLVVVGIVLIIMKEFIIGTIALSPWVIIFLGVWIIT